MSPIQEEQYVIDTRRNARPGGATSHESVRKYICESCAGEMGGAVGMVSGEEAATTRQMLVEETARSAQYLAELEAAQTRVLEFDSVKEALSEVIREELAKTVKPAAGKDAG